MKKALKNQLSELSWAILEVVARCPEAIMYGFVDHSVLKKHLKGDFNFVSDKLIERLKGLKRRGYLQTTRDKGRTSVKLSVEGRIKNIENPFDLRQDGVIRAVSYDIPEEFCSKRRLFCRSLRRIGYVQLQKSLWVCGYSKAEEIDLIIDSLGLSDYVAYFVISKSNIPQLLGKKTKVSEIYRTV